MFNNWLSKIDYTVEDALVSNFAIPVNLNKKNPVGN